MRERGLVEQYKQEIVNYVVLNLTSDMLHYLYEALMSFERRKFSVGYSLLMKPLKEHLFFLSWILADEVNFISRVVSTNYIRFSGVSRETRLSILNRAIDRLHTRKAFNERNIWNYVYSRDYENGFEIAWRRATHLTTSQGEQLDTEDYSFDFIFEDNLDGNYSAFLVEGLPYLFFYLIQIALASLKRICSVNVLSVNHLILITYGCYEALFQDGRNMYVSKELQKTMGDLLSCIHCDAPFKINKRTAPMFYLHERFKCEKCGCVSEFPLYWVLAKSDMKFSSDQ
jgi:hypothetical protein